MSVITEKAVEKGIELLDTASSLAVSEGPKVLQEYLNLMVFDAAMGITPVLLIAFVAFYLGKLLNAWITVADQAVTERVACRDAEKAEHERRHPESAWLSIGHEFPIHRAKDAAQMLRFGRGLLVTASLALSLYVGYHNVKRIGRIVIAPRVFLIQEGASLLKKGESTK